MTIRDLIKLGTAVCVSMVSFVGAANAQIGAFNASNLRDDLYGGADDPIVVTVDGNDFLYAVATTDFGVMGFSIAANGELTPVSDTFRSAAAALDQPMATASAVVGGTTYLFVADRTGDLINVFSVANDGQLTFASSVSDNGTSNLDLLSDIAVAEVGGTTFLMAVSAIDDGVSVFSVGADGTLINTDNENDGGALEIDGAWGLATAEVGGTDYVFVAGVFDDGVSVFSLAANGTLTNTANVGDSGSLELNGPRELTTVDIGGTTFLVVTGYDDDGISIFSVAANGTLSNVYNVNDNGTLYLNGASEASAIDIDGTTYLYVTGALDNGVSVFSMAGDGTLSSVENVLDASTTAIDRASGVVAADINGSPFVYVTGIDDSGITAFSAAANGTLTAIQTLQDNQGRLLDRIYNLTTAVIGGTSYLFAVTENDDSVAVMSVDASGTLSYVGGAADDATLLLADGRAVAVADVGGTAYLYASGETDDGISSFSVAANGSLTNVENLADDGTLNLNSVQSLLAVEVGGTDILVAAAESDFGFSVFTIAANGILTNTANVTDDGTTSFEEPKDLAAVVVDGTTYLVVVGGRFFGGSGATVYSLASNGTVTQVDNVSDSGGLALMGAIAVETAVVDGTTFIIVAGRDESGFSVFSMANNGTLTSTDTVTDDASAFLAYISSLTSFEIDGTSYIAAGSENEDGLSLYSLAANGTATHVSNVADTHSILLDNVLALASMTVGGNTYMFTGAWRDDGVSAFGFDGTPPRIASIERQTPASSPTNADSLTWRVTFSEAVSNVSTSDFTATGTTGSATQVTNPSGNAYDVTVSGGNLASVTGTVTLGFAGGQDITDAAGNALSNTAPTGTNDATFDLDNTAPRIASIERQTPALSPTGADSLTWRVTFDGAVSNVGTADFTASGTTGTVSAVTNPSGNAYDVTVSGGDLASLDGTVTLGFAGGQDIADAVGNTLSNTTPTGTNDNSYVVDNSAPVLTAFERSAPASESTGSDALIFAITFNEPVSNVTADDFTITGTTASGVLNGSGASYTLTLTGGDLANLNGQVGLDLAAGQNIVDGIGLALPAGEPATDETYSVANDVTPPRIASIERFSPASELTTQTSLIWTVTFSEQVSNVTSDDFAVTGGSTASVSNLSPSGLQAYRVTVSGGDINSFSGPVTLAFAGGQDIADTAGNTLTDTAPTGTNEPSYTVDNTPPTLTSIARQTPSGETTNADTVTWRLTFSEDVQGVDEGDFSIAEISGESFSVSGAGAVWDITASGSNLVNRNGVVTLTVATGIRDIVNLGLTSGVPTGTNNNTFTLDNTGPSISSITRSSPATERTNADSVTWQITFNEAATNVSASDFSVSGTTASLSVTSASADQPEYAGAPAPAPSPSGSTTYSVTASGGDIAGLDDYIELSVSGSHTITDVAGNALQSTGVSGTNDNNYQIDNSPASVIEIVTVDTATATNPTVSFYYAFTEPVSDVTLDDFEFITSTGVTYSNARFGFQGPDTGTVLVDVASTAASGTIQGTLKANTDIVDSLGHGNGNVGYVPAYTTVAGAVANVDMQRPTLVSISRRTPSGEQTSADGLTWLVTFSEPVQAVDAADFSLTGSTAGLTAALFENSDQPEFSGAASAPAPVPSSETWLVTATGGDLAGANGTVSLALAASPTINDGVGNTLSDTAASGTVEAYTVDNTAPRIASVSRISPNTEDTNSDTLIWRVTFDEPVGNVDTGDFSVAGSTASVTAVNAVALGDQPEQVGGAIAPLSLATSNAYNVTVSGGDLAGFDGTVTLTALTTGGITDASGNVFSNATPSGANQNSYDVDNTAPTLTSMTRQIPAGEQTNADTLSWRVEFSETVSVDAADFAAGGTTATVSVQAVAGDQAEGAAPAPLPTSSVWTVSVTGGDLAGLDGTVSLSLAASPTINDAVGNSLTNTTATGTVETFAVRNTAPAISSIARLTPNTSPTNADTLVWRVTFSAIDGSFDLPSAAFTVAGTTATVTDVTRFSIGFDVTVSGGDLAGLNGDVTLGLADTDFADDYNNVMDRTIPAGAELTFTVDNAAPSVVIAGPPGPVSGGFTATFTFSEAVAGFELADITVGNGAATDLQSSDNAVFTATISPSADGNVTVNVAADAANDAAGNGNTVAGQFSVENDQTAPRIASITRQTSATGQTDADSVTWRVTFSEFVQNVDAGDFQIAGTTATLSVAPAAIAGDVPAGTSPPPSLNNTFDVTASGGDLANLNGIITLSALTTGGITDNAGNAFANASPTGSNDNSYSVINDAEPPTVLSIVRRTPSSELTNADSLTWRVTFSEPVENVDAADIAASGTTASVTGVSPVAAILPAGIAGAGENGGIVPFAVSTQAFEVTVSGGDLAGLNGPVAIGFATGQNIADAAGNALANTVPAGANQGFTLDNTLPTVAIASSAATPVTGAFPITVTFSEDVTGFDIGDLGLGNGNASNFASSDERTYTATITPGSGATVTVDVAANSASDGAGNGNSAATQFSIGYDNIRTLSVDFTGSGEGNVSSSPAGLDCTDDCNADFIVATEVIVSAIAAEGSTFVEWTDGPCVGTRNENCIVAMNADRSVAARFQLDEPPVGRIVAATLPAARSGYVGGPDMTAFLSVVSRNETPAQGCYVSAASDAPVTVTSARIDASGNAVGEPNPNFDIEAGGTVSLVLGMTPIAETAGYELYPIIVCENAVLDPIQGVNSVSLTIGSAPVPDILSIGVTPSQDGVIRIANSGGAGAMAASAVNIGAGDGSAGATDITLTATVDTGAATLPLSLEMCRINASAQCISPRGASVTTVMAQNDPLFVAVFVRDTSGGAGIAFDPANARVFLRFADASGTVRSVTSVAVTAPAAADAPELASALPEGRWSVLMRQEEGVWPSLTRAALHVATDGRAIADDGVSPRLVQLEGVLAAEDAAQSGQIRQFTRDGTNGFWTSDGRVLSGGAWIDNAGEFYGIRDARTGSAQTWADLAGAFGDGIRISATGEIRGTVAGCSVYGRSTGPASSLVSLTLSGCAASGRYAGVIDLPANDGEAVALVMAGSDAGWRLTAQ